MSSRVYCFFTISLVCAGLAGVAVLNWLVDPYGQYGTGAFPIVIQASRSQKVDLLEQLPDAPSGLILGSSRILKFEPSYLQTKTGISFFNAGVNHGRPTDFLAIVRWYHQRWKVYPKMVVIGVDSASLHQVVPLDARITSESRLASLIPESISWKDRIAPFCELIGFKQVRATITSLKSALKPIHASESIEYYAPDGHIVYRQREAELNNGTYDFNSALEYNQKEFDTLFRTFKELSGPEAIRLVDTVQLLRENGTRVYLFTTPYHPELSKTLAEYDHFHQREDETRRILELLAIHCGAHVVDLSHIESFQGEPLQFVDGIHPLEMNTRKMIDRLLETKSNSDDEPSKLVRHDAIDLEGTCDQKGASPHVIQ